MPYLQLVLFAVGAALLTIGYRRNRRGLMLAAAIVLFLAGGGVDLGSAFAQGIHDGLDAWSH